MKASSHYNSGSYHHNARLDPRKKILYFSLPERTLLPFHKERNREMLLVSILPAVWLCWANADDPLDHFKWKEMVQENDNKTWMPYISALLHRGNSDLLIAFPKWKLKTLNFAFVIELLHHNDFQHQVTGRFRKEVGPWETIQFLVKIVKRLYLDFHVKTGIRLHDHGLHVPRMNIILWKLRLDPKLRSRITIQKLIIYSTFHTNRCQHNATIKTGNRFWAKGSFTLCGIFSKFKFFSQGSNTDFALFYYFFLSFVCSVNFDIASLGLVAHGGMARKSYSFIYRGKIQSVSYNMELPWYKHKVTVEVYSFLTEKHQQILLVLTNNMKAFFFDGPGFLSPKYPVTQNSVHIKSSTFQASLLFLHQTTTEGSVSFEQCHASYKRYRLDGTGEAVTLEYSSSVAQQFIALTVFQAPSDSHVNVSFSHYQYTGHETPDCHFGGVTFYDMIYKERSTSYFAMTSVCAPTMYDVSMMQKLNSISFKLMVVVYSYHQYTQFDVTMQLTSSPCKIMRVNVCGRKVPLTFFRSSFYFSKELPPYAGWWKIILPDSSTGCFVIQLSTDIHAKFQQNYHTTPYYTKAQVCGIRFLLTKSAPPQMYLHSIQGFFSDEFGTLVDSYTQSLEMAGEDIIHNPITDANITEWSMNGIYSKVPEQANASDDYHSAPRVEELHQDCSVKLNTEELKAKTFHIFLCSWLPAHKKSKFLKVKFQGIRGRSWMDIYLRPSNHCLSVAAGKLNLQTISQRWIKATRIIEDWVLVLNSASDEVISRLFVNVSMQVKFSPLCQQHKEGGFVFRLLEQKKS